MANVFLVDLEPVETRYTGQWKSHVPELLRKAGHNVQILSGPTDIPSATTPGAFLNFGGTNIYKSLQVEGMGRLFCSGAIKPGDHFLFTDAWHPGIINLKYMSELLQIPVTIHALWHAGSYDPQDFLGRLIGDAKWVRHAEISFFSAIDHNYFATQFHIQMFADVFADGADWWIKEQLMTGKIVRSGWPMEYLDETLSTFKDIIKEDIILFPHRIAPEKQLNIFKDLADAMPEYQWIVAQEHQLTKQQYHELLGRSRIVFSANLQETLGISCYEALCVNAFPMVPNRLSYTEMYPSVFKYDSRWTESFDSYLNYKDRMIEYIRKTMNEMKGQGHLESIVQSKNIIKNNFFTASAILGNIK